LQKAPASGRPGAARRGYPNGNTRGESDQVAAGKPANPGQGTLAPSPNGGRLSPARKSRVRGGMRAIRVSLLSSRPRTVLARRRSCLLLGSAGNSIGSAYSREGRLQSPPIDRLPGPLCALYHISPRSTPCTAFLCGRRGHMSRSIQDEEARVLYGDAHRQPMFVVGCALLAVTNIAATLLMLLPL
jgi:hypothetical protein